MITGIQPGLDWRGILQRVPRHPFVAEIYAAEAAKDANIPIGHGVYASKPSTIARMLDLLGPCHRVLEIGTGCGWQTALLTLQAQEVFSIEYIHGLYERSTRDLRALGYDVTTRHGDGFAGWPEHAPFDGIIAACAVPVIGDGLLAQLSIGGRIVAPVGDASTQRIVRITRTATGIETEDHGPAGFTAARH
ncbi:MAG: protein-L-isoaspartate O-methyltransferase [Kiritimatiellia bacterium]